MKKDERILKKIAADKELQKNLSKQSDHYGNEMFLRDGKRYLKAIKEGRMLCIIESVSASGMSRVLKFNECAKLKGNNHSFMQFWTMFKVLGHQETKSQGFRVHGCGMDMVFHTNYCIVRKLQHLGFISKKQCAVLEQKTPTIL